MDSTNILGTFLPPLLRMGINCDTKDIFEDAPQNIEFDRTLIHEYVHFLQTIGTTYGINVHADVIDYISQTLAEMGGAQDLIIQSMSDNSKSSIKELDDLLMYHYLTLDGGYGSSEYYEDSRDTGLTYLTLNRESACWEFVRWNFHDNCYFATPIGSIAIQECYAYVVEQHQGADPAHPPAIETQLDLPCNDYSHYYTAPLEAFINSISANQLKTADIVATFLATLDMCLMIPGTKYRSHPDWAPMTSPSFRFFKILPTLSKVKLVTDFSAQEYFRFTEEISAALHWPSPTKVAKEFLEVSNSYLESLKNFLHEEIDSDPKRFHDWVDIEVRRFKHDTIIQPGHRLSKESYNNLVERMGKEYQDSILSNPLMYLGLLGTGIFEYMVKALEIRITRPDILLYPPIHTKELFNQFPVPQITLKTGAINQLNSVSAALFMDVQGLTHLWPMVLQWKEGLRNNILCGNRYLNIPCVETPYKEGLCPKWSGRYSSTPIRCTFTQVLKYFDLMEK